MACKMYSKFKLIPSTCKRYGVGMCIGRRFAWCNDYSLVGQNVVIY